MSAWQLHIGGKLFKSFVFSIFFFAASVASAQYAAENDEALALAQAGNMQAAWDIWKPLADAGDARAQSNIGTMYDKGILVAEDDREAVKWFFRSAASGFSTGQYNLAIMYSKGYGVEVDQVEAIYWFKAAAYQRNPHAQIALAHAYLTAAGVYENKARAYMWLALAAQAAPEVVGTKLIELEGILGNTAVAEGRAMFRQCLHLELSECDFL